MDIRQLRYFVQIVECGSLSQAAREMHIAQPALSQQIAKLEAEVGQPLLSRSSKGVAATENGIALYHHGRFMLRQFDQALEIARGPSGAVRGVVTVGLPSTTVAAIGMPLLRRLRERYPDVLLKIIEGMSGHLAQMARLGQLDLAVLFRREDNPEMDAEPLMNEELFVIAAGDTALISPERVALEIGEVSRLPLILPTREHGLRQRIDAEFESRGLVGNLVAQIDSLSLVMDCVHAGMGVTIKPMGAIMREQEGGRRFRSVRFDGLEFRRPNFLCSRPVNQLTPAAAVVREQIRETVAALVGSDARNGFSAAA